MRFLLVLAMLAMAAIARELNDSERDFAYRQVETLRDELQDGDMSRLAARGDQTLNRIVMVGINRLHRKGEHALANQAELDWNTHYRGYLSRGFAAGYGDIGDHKPLIQWLENFYDKLEAKLGVDLCKLLHLSDIKSLNMSIPVVFHPCTFDMGSVAGSREDEYRRHFSQGAVYYGFLPVVAYWTTDIACVFGTSGILVMMCGMVGSVAEIACARWVAPGLSDRIYTRACVK